MAESGQVGEEIWKLLEERRRNSRVDEEPSEDEGLYLYDRDGGPKFGTNRAMCPSWRTLASLI